MLGSEQAGALGVNQVLAGGSGEQGVGRASQSAGDRGSGQAVTAHEVGALTEARQERALLKGET